MTSATRFAPAKVNLALHVTGRRADGYHLIDTLVAFPSIGDTLAAAPAEATALAIGGRFGDGLAADPANLVLRAHAALEAEAGRALPIAFRLDKELPVASGIGGGSADAAAALRLVAEVAGLALSEARLAEIGLTLGADVPMCLAGRSLRARGVGEVLEPAPAPPEGAGVVLVNPGVAVPTPAVFAALERRDSPPLPPLPEAFEDAAHLADWLGGTRNDLSAPAIRVAPVIAEVLEAIRRTPGCRLARMSGSGATAFGLFDDEEAAARAAARLSATGWWVEAGTL